MSSIYWGAIVKGQTYNLTSDPPWDLAPWDRFESNAGKRLSILGMGSGWHRASQPGYVGILDGHMSRFYPGDFEKIRSRGALCMFTWGSYSSPQPSPAYDAPDYKLSRITSGYYDAYIRQWASDAKAWGHPFLLRFDWEMNGTWYPWSEARNGNQPGEYIAAWRHVHDIFTSVGANNATWVWCPNVTYAGSLPLAGLYPGDAYVDWIGLDGYNKDATWKSFSQVFAASYAEVQTLAPAKPIMLCEFASNEASDGGARKAAWITDALAQLPTNFPNVKGISWFDWNSDSGSSYVIESSAQSQAAFAAGIASDYYAVGTFADLPLGSKVLPLTGDVPTPTPPPTDTRPPLITILWPTNGAIVPRKSRVPVQVAASDDVRVERVEFQVNGSPIYAVAVAPYTYEFTTTGRPNAQYRVEAVAYDADGNSARATVTVRTS